jgi:hypothetical protein
MSLFLSRYFFRAPRNGSLYRYGLPNLECLRFSYLRSPFTLPRRTEKLEELFLALEVVGLKVFEVRRKLPGSRTRPT